MKIGLETISLIITILLAFIGYIVTYLNNLSMTRRAERLHLITTQINEFYGPLYVITQTSARLLKALKEKARSEGRTFVDDDAPKSVDDVSDWRVWLETVFIPMNERLEDIIIQKSHLIREQEMPSCLQNFVAHNAGYKALVMKWKLGDFSEAISLIPYPNEISEYAKNAYQELKQEQLKIIAMSKKNKWSPK
jgi:hypothetical protein